MFKLIYFLWHRPGMSIEDFSHHYETVHIPACLQKIPRLRVTDHRRNYPEWTLIPASAAASQSRSKARRLLEDFTVLTEVWHPQRENLEAILIDLRQSPTREWIEQEDRRFVDLKRDLMLVVEEHVSDLGHGHSHGQSQRLDKYLRFVRAHPSLEPRAFKECFEEQYAPRAVAGMAQQCMSYSRNYLCYDDAISSPVAFRKFHVIEEFWLSTPHPSRLEPVDLPSLSAAEELIDATGTCHIRVEERTFAGSTALAAPQAATHRVWQWEQGSK